LSPGGDILLEEVRFLMHVGKYQTALSVVQGTEIGCGFRRLVEF